MLLKNEQDDSFFDYSLYIAQKLLIVKENSLRMLKRIKRTIKFYIWASNGYIGRRLSVKTSAKVTVLITYYHPLRMKDINHQIRNLLKCDFVEKLVISNHNPEIKIEKKVAINDERLIYINQNIRQACGFRWHIINKLYADYVISIDDDILLFPVQLKKIFQHLLREPEIPHGISGFIRSENEELQYRERENIDVHYLCEIYAVTRKQVERYFEIERLMAKTNANLPTIAEQYGDFIVISQTGSKNPKIHKTGNIFRSESFKTLDIAMHKDELWENNVQIVSRAVQEIRFQEMV